MGPAVHDLNLVGAPMRTPDTERSKQKNKIETQIIKSYYFLKKLFILEWVNFVYFIVLICLVQLILN